VGNSSSGISEVPSFKVPTVNIGIRQKGRLRGNSVVDCEPTVKGIKAAIDQALAIDTATIVNPYEQPDTAARMLDILKNYPLENLNIKKFYNIKVQ